MILTTMILLLQAGCISPRYWETCSPNDLMFGGKGVKCMNWCKSFMHKDPCSAKWYPSFKKFEPTLDDFAVKEAAKKCAHHSLKGGKGYGGLGISKDYKSGYQQAHVDFAMGGNGVTPPIPPENYWVAYRRTPEGHAQAQEWFQGYQAGTQAVQQTSWAAYRNIPSSGRLQAPYGAPLGAEFNGQGVPDPGYPVEGPPLYNGQY